jgi:DNA invertase Pin-like site-specific DNA recombinase
VNTSTTRPLAWLYLRLSDLRHEEQLEGREDKLRAEAARLDWDVYDVIVENDLTPAAANGNGRSRPASAFKRRKIRLPNGQVALRTVRPGFRSVLDGLTDPGCPASAVLAEDLDRLLRQPRDGEDLIDAVELSGATVRSLTGSVNLTRGGTSDEQFMARIMASVASKSSADTARRVAAGRERHAGKSYQGGKRPFGFRHDPKAPQHRKTLVIVEDEARVIRDAAQNILRDGPGALSLKAITADLRRAGVPTVTGAAWTPSTLRDVLLKPAVAGLAVDPATRELIDAPWPAILDRDVWKDLRDKLTDPSRKTSPGNEPRWLVSKTARCPQCGSTVRVNGVRQGRAAYVCDQGGHLKRAAAKVDEVVEGRMIWRLSQPDAGTLLAPPPLPGDADAAVLRAELRDLARRRREQVDLHSAGIITRADLVRGMHDIEDRTAQVKARLAQARRDDPLAEFRGRPADVVWDSLPVARKRAVIRLLADITFAPVAPSGPVFNRASVVITWKA